jgi:hypothetical protein
MSESAVWRKFFAACGEYAVILKFYECERVVDIEELYQAFKARMRDEPPITREERIAQLRAEIDWLLAGGDD